MTDRCLSHRFCRLPALLLVSVACVSGLGCSLFRSHRSPPDQTADTAETVERSQVASTVPVKPGKHALRISQFVFYSDVPLEASDPLFRELEDLPDQIQRKLRLPPGNTPVQVFLFEDKERYEAYIRARDPKLPDDRPAYFFAEQRGSGLPDDLYVFTWLSPRLRTDLRHELTHALLHSVLKSVPLWLDEGLASYFELSPSSEGVNPSHLEAVRSPSFQPNLGRLEKLESVNHMSRPKYQESWAWIHFMLHGHPKARSVLLEYLQSLRTSNNPGTLQARLEAVFPDPQVMLVDHVSRIDSGNTTKTRVSHMPN